MDGWLPPDTLTEARNTGNRSFSTAVRETLGEGKNIYRYKNQDYMRGKRKNRSVTLIYGAGSRGEGETSKGGSKKCAKKKP